MTPTRFPDRDEIAAVREEAGKLEPGVEAPEERRLAGRVLGRREMGKLTFLDLVAVSDPRLGLRHLEVHAEEPGEERGPPLVARHHPAPGGVVLERAREHPARLLDLSGRHPDDFHPCDPNASVRSFSCAGGQCWLYFSLAWPRAPRALRTVR